MGSVAEAVLEFDEAVRVPWRPPLAGAVQSTERPSGFPVFASPTTRRPRAARAARLTVPPPPPAVSPAPPRPGPSGSTALGHACARCARDDRVPPSLRLTRRARRLLAVVAAAGAVLVGVWVGSFVAEADAGLVLVSDTSVVVQGGDTLWSIAGSVAGDDRDVRSVVDAIYELNGLRSTTLQPGQVLRLP